MAISSGACPGCGARIEFRAGAALSVVCAHCHAVVVRTDRSLENLGKVADVVHGEGSLAPHDRGTFRGRSFEVRGRLVLQHPAGGQWEEFFVELSDGRPAWLSEAQGFWQVVEAAPGIAVPPAQSLSPGQTVVLGALGPFVVGEKNVGRFLSAEGELPFAARPGTERLFVDLSAAGGRWASIDYGDGSAAPQLFVGVQTSRAELQIQPRGDERPAEKVAIGAIKCPGCGADMPVLAAGTERAACRSCGALSDIKLQQVVARQQRARLEPGIELGRRGVLPFPDARGASNVEWTVIGYMERSTGSGEEFYGWQEYLLYNAQHGYRWLVYDEGQFLYVTPMNAGEVDASRAPSFVRMGSFHFKLRNKNPVRVDHVLGEFYWKVEVGETVHAEDYVHNRDVVSCERAAGEVNWSYSRIVPIAAITHAFGFVPKAGAYGGAPRGAAAGESSPSAGVIVLVVIVIVLIFMAGACGSCGGGGGGSYSPSVRGGGSSGFGGK